VYGVGCAGTSARKHKQVHHRQSEELRSMPMRRCFRSLPSSLRALENITTMLVYDKSTDNMNANISVAADG
jgi:hypothetical protein